MGRFMTKKETVAIIPARGGSKGLQRKNLAKMAGVPLIAYSIMVAQEISAIDRVVVSTDDQEIAEVAKAYGAEVPILRPAALANDVISYGQAVRHLFDHMYGGIRSAVGMITLLPTSPFRDAEELNKVIAKSIRKRQKLISVKKVPLPRKGYVTHDEISNELNTVSIGSNSQHFYRPYGLVSLQYPNLHKPHTMVYEIKNKMSLVDIDTQADLNVARRIVENNLFDFNAPALEELIKRNSLRTVPTQGLNGSSVNLEAVNA